MLTWLLAAPALAGWSVVQGPDPVDGQNRCLIRSDTLTLQDGYGETPVTLVGNGQKWVLITRSELDSSFADLELVVDSDPPLKGEIGERNTHLVFPQNYADLLERFKAGRTVTVYLRFWPTWPATQRFSAEFSLKGFTKAHGSFLSCR